MTETLIARYFDTLRDLSRRAEATELSGKAMAFDAAIAWTGKLARATHAAGDKIMFIGNGGSAGIASHLAIDFTKNGGMRSTAFNDGAALTCLANDLGYDQVFAKQIDMHARAGDFLVAISSGGRSANILKGVEAAKARGCKVLTLSGFQPDNPLRRMGDVNLYVASDQYGFVEILHLTFCHLALDLAMNWQGEILTPRA